MNTFTADIGCWEHGKNVDLPNSHTIDGALEEAEQILAVTTFSKPISDPFIVQIKLNGQPVWDYMNGRYSEGAIERASHRLTE